MRWPTILPTSCAPWLCRGCQALVADLVAAKAGEDWSQDRRPRPVRHVPDGRGCGAEELVRRNPAADCSTPGAASTSVRRSLMPMLQQTTGELCLADHKRRHQRAGVAVLTAIPTKSRRIPSRTALIIASAGDPNYRLLTNRGSSGECQVQHHGAGLQHPPRDLAGRCSRLDRRREGVRRESGQIRAPHIDPRRPGAPSSGLPAPIHQITWDRCKSW